MSSQKVIVLSNVSEANREAMCDILDGLVGTPLERSGDISITVADECYVISGQAGHYAAAAVSRPDGVEVARSAQFRSDVVDAVAGNGLVKASGQAVGQEFTLKQLVADEWDDLSPVEQRTAGKRFRRLLAGKPFGDFSDRKSSDNEWHYTRL